MERKAKKYIFDMIQACEAIATFTSSKTLDDYRGDALLKSAVERQFQIIGEALDQLFRYYPEVAMRITEHRNIINLRHILVHGYDRTDDDVMWGILSSRLPQLSVEVRNLLLEG